MSSASAGAPERTKANSNGIVQLIYEDPPPRETGMADFLSDLLDAVLNLFLL